MEEENEESEKDFPGLYASDPSYKSDSDYNENSYEKGGKKELLKSKKKDKNKDKGYAALDAESSEEEMDILDLKNSLKTKRPKSFRFLQKKDKEEKEKEEKKEERRKRDDKDDKKKEKKKEKEERKLREKEEKKKTKKDKKKKGSSEGNLEESYPIFGVPLSIAVERSPSHDGIRLPAVVRECIDHVEEQGLNCEGIYRMGGVKSKVQELRRVYNAGEATRLSDQHPHIVASLLKQFLREVPETILTVDMMPHFEDVCLIPNPRERAEAMRQLIDRLPTTNKLLLQYVLKHMGHVIEREKETKMSSHSVCVVLSPTMQISHRVLNVMFHSHQYLFGNVQIKRYVPPITSYSGANRTIEDLRTSSEIADEMAKQESLLTCLHSAVAAGRTSQKTEEQLWEAQRIVTLLKRKLKSAYRKETCEGERICLESYQEPSSEESQKEGPPSPRAISPSKERIPSEVEDEENGKKAHHEEVKSSSETDTGTTSPSIKTLSDGGERKSSEEEANSGSSSRTRDEKKEDAAYNEPVIPMLPKPVSARAERSKWSQSARDKNDHSLHKNNGESTAENETVAESKKMIVKTQYAEVGCSESRRISHEKDSLQRNTKMTEISEDTSVTRDFLCALRTNLNGDRTSQVFADGYLETKKRGSEMNKKSSLVLTEDLSYASLLLEDARLTLEHEELLSVNQELTRKLQAEKAEISRLRDEIQEMQTLYGYRTHSYDSSESEGSDSEVDSDNEEEETRKQIVAIDKSNKLIKMDNAALTKRIQDEREAVIRLRVSFRQNQVNFKAANPIRQMC